MKESLIAVSLSLLQITGGGPSESAAIQQFNAEIAKYMAIRSGLLTEVSGTKPESTSVQLNNASDALSAAIRRRRPNAKPGSLFTPEVARFRSVRPLISAALSEEVYPRHWPEAPHGPPLCRRSPAARVGSAGVTLSGVWVDLDRRNDIMPFPFAQPTESLVLAVFGELEEARCTPIELVVQLRPGVEPRRDREAAPRVRPQPR